MKFIFFVVFTIYVVQAKSVEELRNIEVYDDITDAHFEVKQVQKDINQYEEKILSDVRKFFDENAEILLKETLQYEIASIDYTGKNKTALDLCLEKIDSKLAVYMNIENEYKVCQSKAEIKYYQVPLVDYKYILFAMSEILERHVNESAVECKYWEKNSPIDMSLSECFNLKRPGINAILYGLQKMTVRLQSLIFYSGEKLKAECKICAANQKLKLEKELFNIQVKIDLCLKNN